MNTAKANVKRKGIDLRPLKQWLQKGQIEEAATKYGVTKTQASLYMSGNFPNYGFAKIILAMVAENKALAQQVESLSIG